jgi:hypothetical protein
MTLHVIILGSNPDISINLVREAQFGRAEH